MPVKLDYILIAAGGVAYIAISVSPSLSFRDTGAVLTHNSTRLKAPDIPTSGDFTDLGQLRRIIETLTR